MKKVVIIGGGFGGVNAARVLGGKEVDVTLIDRRNHHLFQPLLYQVAMAGLSPADIAAPIRGMLAPYQNIRVLLGEVQSVDLKSRTVLTDCSETGCAGLPYDYLIMACGAQHAYFGHEEWEEHAPGLKTLEQATEIRRRVLSAFEAAEKEADPKRQKRLLTFIVIGGGATGVELAGAIGEMSRFTLASDFRKIDPAMSRVILIEAGSRILSAFAESLSQRAVRDLERLGVEVWTSKLVTMVDADGVMLGDEKVPAATVLWGAGVQASGLGKELGVELDRQGRVKVQPDLSIKGCPEVFVVGDQANFPDENGEPLPGLAPVALQQGRCSAGNILRDIAGRPRQAYRYFDKGHMATIGRSKAIGEVRKIRFSGFTAWLAWLLVHIYYLTGFRNRLFVVLQWGWSYLTFSRGARLIMNRDWHSYHPRSAPGDKD
ncbi:MAG TPA: NAD(P)/FAD-dependent oxidoreductase [Candidatus Methylomirabilis sp.]|nr:NAD(P)/FAD-dependent oxidoreductase [Candidatus Methylomirabilis sp.]